MFNPLRPSQLVAVMSNQLKIAGRAEQGLTSFEREQMLSAYSLGRHLQGEIEALAHLEDLAQQLALELARIADGLEGKPSFADANSFLRAAADELASGDVPLVGKTLCDLLELVGEPEPGWEGQVAEAVKLSVKEMVSAEIRALAAATA